MDIVHKTYAHAHNRITCVETPYGNRHILLSKLADFKTKRMEDIAFKVTRSIVSRDISSKKSNVSML